MKIKKKMIRDAVQQMIGFKIGKWGACPRELVSSMGLSKDEWEYIKKNEDGGFLDEKDVIEIDEYFNELKNGNNTN